MKELETKFKNLLEAQQALLGAIDQYALELPGSFADFKTRAGLIENRNKIRTAITITKDWMDGLCKKD